MWMTRGHFKADIVRRILQQLAMEIIFGGDVLFQFDLFYLIHRFDDVGIAHNPFKVKLYL